MSNKVKYSIIVPVYNRPEEINQLILSISNQSFKNLEVIIVDDGSQISSRGIFQNFRNNVFGKISRKCRGPPYFRKKKIVFDFLKCIENFNFFFKFQGFLKNNSCSSHWKFQSMSQTTSTCR